MTALPVAHRPARGLGQIREQISTISVHDPASWAHLARSSPDLSSGLASDAVTSGGDDRGRSRIPSTPPAVCGHRPAGSEYDPLSMSAPDVVQRSAVPSRRGLGAAVLAVAAMLAVPAVAAAASDVERMAEARKVREEWMHGWNPAWAELVFAVVAVSLYAVRAGQLGDRLPRWRVICFFSGIFTLTFAVSSPIDPVGENGLFFVHMIQHMLLGDLAGLLLVLGVNGPMLRPLLHMRWVQALRHLTHPVVAFILWAAVFVGWHIPFLYAASLDNEVVHAVQHVSFITAGILIWAPVFEVFPAPEWFGSGAKVVYLIGVRSVDMVLSNIFWWSGTVLYPRFEDTAPLWGISAKADQVHAGTVMMAWTGTVTMVVATIFFFRMAKESAVRQALIEGGVDPARARRAVRYGRGEVLAKRYGIEITDNP